MKKKNYLITIVGPTAIGKTSLSIQLANYYGCEIISCDSRQFFKEMQIGTAAPTADELAAAPHHFVHNISIQEQYTVGDFERDAIQKLDELFERNNVQIMVGGSGLYVNAVLEGFDQFPDIAPEVREQVKQDYADKGLGYLREQLAEHDPDYYDHLAEENPQTLLNPQRLMRFVEVSRGSGQPYSSFLNKKDNVRNFTPIIIGLDGDRDELYDRINQRVDTMLADGLLKEAEGLAEHRSLNALQTVGYKEVFAFFDGKDSFPRAIAEIKKNTRRFAKRQLTWFKRSESTTWFDYKTTLEEIIKVLQDKVDG